MAIAIRPLRESEIPEAIRVVDFAFRTNPASIVREPSVWRWRYWEMPGFDPRGAVAAFDGDRLVGMVMATLRRLWLGRWVLFGVIDDVSTLPLCRGKGVARKMMNEALRFVREAGAEATLLYADPKGVARNLYLDLGYGDFHRFDAWLKPVHGGLAIRQFPGFLPLAPGFHLWSALRAPGRTGGPVRDLGGFRAALEEGSSHLAGLPDLGGGIWEWMRKTNPTRPEPVGDPPRAGCTLCPLKIHFLSSIDLEGAWLGDLFSRDGSDPLPAALARARERGLSFLVGLVSRRDHVRERLLRKNGFLPFMGATMMVKSFSAPDLEAFRDRPWFPMLESAVGLP